MGWRLASVAVAASVLLTGCVSVAPVDGVSDAEREAYRLANLEEQWEFTRLPDELRPAPEPFEYLPESDRLNRYLECVTGLSPGNFYSVGTDGLLVISVTGGRSVEQRLADYRCSEKYPARLEDLGFISAEQREALYRYYERWLIPCLESQGIPVTRPNIVPDFDAMGRVKWNPLDSVPESHDRNKVDEVCGPYPDTMSAML